MCINYLKDLEDNSLKQLMHNNFRTINHLEDIVNLLQVWAICVHVSLVFVVA